MDRLGDFFTLDDLWSLIGWLFLSMLMRAVNSDVDLAIASLLASGMLTIFWLASRDVRARTSNPNARVVVWGLVAAASLVFYLLPSV